MKTFTVLIPAPKGHTGGVPYEVATEKDGAFKGKIPFDKEVTGIAEAVVNVLKDSYPDAVYTEESEAEGKGKGKKK